MSGGENGALVLLLYVNLSPEVCLIGACACAGTDNNADDDGKAEGEHPDLVLLLPVNVSPALFVIFVRALAGADNNSAFLVLLLFSNLSPAVFVIVDGACAGADSNSDDKSEGKEAPLVLPSSSNLSPFVILDGVR